MAIVEDLKDFKIAKKRAKKREFLAEKSSQNLIIP